MAPSLNGTGYKAVAGASSSGSSLMHGGQTRPVAGGSNGPLVTEQSEEIVNWKENAPLLYDSLLTHILEWPSLSVQFLQHTGEKQSSEHGEVTQSLLIGTHTADGEPNAILVMDVLVPDEPVTKDRRFASYNDYAGFGFGTATCKFNIRHGLAHNVGEPIRIRAMPQKQEVFGSISVGGAVTVMDASGLEAVTSFSWDHLQQPTSSLSLVGHQQEGWALDWSPLQPGWLATGADDTTVCIWDIQKTPIGCEANHIVDEKRKDAASATSLSPVSVLTGHTAAVQDVTWHPSHTALVLSVGDDGRFMIWDTRKPGCAETVQNNNTEHGKSINTIAVNPCRPVLFATGGEEEDIVIWDMRHTSEPVYRMSGHESAISRIQWCPSSERYLAASGTDRLVLVWDLYSIGKEVQGEESSDGPSELLFTHAGHTGMVHDISWNPNEGFDMMLASVSEDNQLQVWTIGEAIAFSDSSDADDDDDDTSSFEVE